MAMAQATQEITSHCCDCNLPGSQKKKKKKILKV